MGAGDAEAARAPGVAHLSRMKSASSLVATGPCFTLWYSTSKPWFFSPCRTGAGLSIGARPEAVA